MKETSKWEYLTIFVKTDARRGTDGRSYIEERWPDKGNYKYMPEAMLPELNILGQEGWEQIHIQPVQKIGLNADVGFVHSGNMPETTWSGSYFCVFKRNILWRIHKI
jgi:hypothetical protein